jgi:peroxiredoxin
VHRRYKDRLTVLAIDMEETREKVAAWVKAKNTSFTVLLDPSGAVSSRYEVTATPTVYVVSRDGKLIAKALGTKPWTSPAGRALLDRLTGQ